MCEQIKFFSRLHQYYFSSFPMGWNRAWTWIFQSGGRAVAVKLKWCCAVLVSLWKHFKGKPNCSWIWQNPKFSHFNLTCHTTCLLYANHASSLLCCRTLAWFLWLFMSDHLPVFPLLFLDLVQFGFHCVQTVYSMLVNRYSVNNGKKKVNAISIEKVFSSW